MSGQLENGLMHLSTALENLTDAVETLTVLVQRHEEQIKTLEDREAALAKLSLRGVHG